MKNVNMKNAKDIIGSNKIDRKNILAKKCDGYDGSGED